LVCNMETGKNFREIERNACHIFTIRVSNMTPYCRIANYNSLIGSRVGRRMEGPWF